MYFKSSRFGSRFFGRDYLFIVVLVGGLCGEAGATAFRGNEMFLLKVQVDIARLLS